MNRRHYLGLVGLAGTTTLAGCAEDGDEPGTDGTGTETEGAGNETNESETEADADDADPSDDAGDIDDQDPTDDVEDPSQDVSDGPSDTDEPVEEAAARVESFYEWADYEDLAEFELYIERVAGITHSASPLIDYLQGGTDGDRESIVESADASVADDDPDRDEIEERLHFEGIDGDAAAEIAAEAVLVEATVEGIEEYPTEELTWIVSPEDGDWALVWFY